MNFIKEIKAHLNSFETDAENEIRRFIDYLESKYQAPAPAVVAPAVVSMPAPAEVAPVTVALTPAEAETPTLEAEPAPTTCAPAVEPTSTEE